MEFVEAFRKVIDNVDPVANLKMTHENTPIKVLADWARTACKELDKYRWLSVSEGLPEESGQYLVCDFSDINHPVFVVSWFHSESKRFNYSQATHYKPITLSGKE